jgi:ribosomal protein S18 acetylase RimI-like enzyme
MMGAAMDPPEIVLRPAVKADIPALADLTDGIQHFHAGFEPEIFRDPIDKAGLETLYTDILAKDGHVILLADKAGRAGGYLWYEIQHKHTDSLFINERRAIFVHHLYVAPAWTRKGIGRAFVTALKSALKTHNCRNIELDTLSQNAGAIEFYRALGFRETVTKFSLP